MPTILIPGDLHQVLAELELVSQVSAVNMDPSSRDASESIGGKRPPGGIDRRDDLPDSDERHHPQKTVDHFRRRLECARTDRQVEVILTDARAALVAWRRQPAPASGDMAFGSPQWKRWVAESSLSHGEVATKWGCTRSYVQQIRKLYRVEAR